jgi:hypothetical protein
MALVVASALGSALAVTSVVPFTLASVLGIESGGIGSNVKGTNFGGTRGYRAISAWSWGQDQHMDVDGAEGMWEARRNCSLSISGEECPRSGDEGEHHAGLEE